MTATLTTLDMDKVEKSEELFVATMLIASNKETKLTDSIVQEWADEGFPVVASTERFVKLYVGDNSFIKDIQRRVNRGGKITLRQARAVLNITVQTFNKVTPERVNTYRCFNCKTATFATASEVRTHYKACKKGITAPTAAPAAPQEPPAPHEYRCGLSNDRTGGRCDFKHTDYGVVREHKRAVHYAPLFEGVEPTAINLGELPDGRYAVPDLSPGKGDNDYHFLMVKRMKRRVMRSKKYRYGYITYGTEEVAEGTIEVRLWHGDAKELVGEQRPGENYRSDHLVNEFRVVLADPVASMMLFSKVIGDCGRCGKTLTDPESRTRGIGPECIKHYNKFTGDPGKTSFEREYSKEELREKLVQIGREGSTSAAWL